MADAPSTPRRAQIQAAVLRATEELLADGAPFAELNVEKIATAAGISRTAFYFYFRDKRELLMRLTADVSDALFEAAEVWIAGDGADGQDPNAELQAALGSVAALYAEHATLLRAIVEVSTYDEEVATFWRGIMQRFADASARRIEAEQAAGRATGVPPAETGFALVWMTERTLYQQMAQGLDGEALVRAIAGIWQRAVYGA